MLMVGGTARMEGRFTINGVLTDPTTVSMRVKPPTGAVQTPTPTKVSNGVFEHVQNLTEAGTWAWEMVGTGDAAGVFGDTFTVLPSVIDGPAHAAHLVSTGDVAIAMGVNMLTDAQIDRAEQLIPQVVALLERVLNRTLVQRTFTNEKHVISQDRRLWPFHGPVQSVTGIRFGAEDAALSTGYNDTWAETEFTPGEALYVTYVAGEAAPDPQIQGVVADAVAGALLAGPAVATGAISSYSVEGTSISYGPGVSGGGAAGRLTVADLGALRPLKRLVWR